ncbi:transmembrane protein 130 [Caerostris darwini]|uniref:Transmembrane protein 130 n=1 Tax=Caerostris darwini TaxID=1538125 RepID=A0AAV4WJI0_9ARAC|nr:transmembrane protein 130 [Caerostris darwini]
MNSLLQFCKILLLIIFGIYGAVSSPQLLITNSEIAVLDSNVTFTAVLKNYETSSKLIYIFDDGVQKATYEAHNYNISFERSYSSSLYKEGDYCVSITVYTDYIIFEKTVVANTSAIKLKRDLIGEIFVYRQDQPLVDADEVAVGENVSIVVGLVNNDNYLDNAAIDYSWSVDFEKLQTLNNTLIYNFTEAGEKDIKAYVTALFPNNDFKYGIFDRTINAKVPVTYINITGNPFLYHGDTLNLNVTCDGSPPFVYCYEIFKKNGSSENFTCSHSSTFTTCRMEIIKYLQEDGMYQIGIYVNNNVREITRIIEVMVYSVTIKPTLSTIIIPIVCSLLTLVIIAFGISYYVQHRNQLAVEVANFDFQDDSNSYTERTFFENIFDSFACRNCTYGRANRSESEPLMD